MNTLIKNLFNSQVRLALGVLGGFLVAKGWTTANDWGPLAEALAPIVVAGAWAVLDDLWQRRKQLTGQAMPAGTTEKQVDHEIKKGNTPPATLDKHETPFLPSEAPPKATEPYRGDLP